MAKNKPSNKAKSKTSTQAQDLGKLKDGDVILNFNDNSEIITHLFQLKTAKMTKYEGWKNVDSMPPAEKKLAMEQFMRQYDHEHSYRTLTSLGEWMNGANAVGGHYHLCEVILNEKTGQPVAVNGMLQIKVGPAVTERGGVIVPYPWDQHTHEAIYVRSNRIKVQSISPEVVQKIAALDQAMGLRKIEGAKIG